MVCIKQTKKFERLLEVLEVLSGMLRHVIEIRKDSGEPSSKELM